MTSGWPGLIETVRRRGDETLLIRPDGVVAWAGDIERDPVGLESALLRWTRHPQHLAVIA